MVTLIPQLKEDIQNLFSEREDSLNVTTVKDAYEELPEGKYPLIVIEEIENTENIYGSTTQGERRTNLGYNIQALARDTEEYTAKQAAKIMLDIVADYLQPPRYNLSRGGRTPIIPDNRDNTIMFGTQTYTCVYDYDTNLIYRS
jgi:hypothetical protein